MTGVIPFILILVSLSIIIVIVVRKFPQLSLLDIENTPEGKEAQKKGALIKKRLEKRDQERTEGKEGGGQRVSKAWKGVQTKFRALVDRLYDSASKAALKKKQEENTERAPADVKQEISRLLSEADSACANEEWDSAEKKLIAVIRIDPKNKEAYQGLGHVYTERDEYTQAEETYRFLLQLDSEDDSTLIRLGDLTEKMGEIERAIECYQQAVIINPNLSGRFAKLSELLFSLEQYESALESIREAIDIEPHNPKYLDSLVETSIMIGDQVMAMEAYEQLRMANPENQKLPVFKDRIDNMVE